MTLGDRLKTWRAAKNVHQREVAAACRVSVSAVCMWEKGDSKPSLKHLGAVAKFFGVSETELERILRRFYDVPGKRAA